ncbi:hypothetical protein HMPREF2660_06515 [Weeksella sp. HMSC059D05]|nr:hypothetical protein HMPREF2660_06515 [Weeksella sp. HMSC059D05]
MFAGFSVLISRFSQKLVIIHSLFYALIILCFELFLCVFGTINTLYFGSILIGVGICIGNVIPPGYIKK